MTNQEALDIIFNFVPGIILKKIKKEGFYDLILSKKITEGAQIYDYISEEHAVIQDADYSQLAKDLHFIMNNGSVFQIACGRGDLLLRLANLKFSPIYAIDRSKTMLNTAKKRLNRFENIFFYQEKIEEFDFRKMNKVNNVIINNFWGMISEKESKKLLFNLKKILTKNSLIFIGNYPEKKINKEKKMAIKVLKNNLGFIFSYPFFKDFNSCGYNAKLTELAGLKYFILKLN